MKIKLLLAFLSVIFSANVFSCVAPNKSKEIDKLISLTWDDALFTYFIYFPKEVQGQKFDNVVLNISNDGRQFENIVAELKPYPEKDKLMVRVQAFADINKQLSIAV